MDFLNVKTVHALGPPAAAKNKKSSRLKATSSTAASTSDDEIISANDDIVALPAGSPRISIRAPSLRQLTEDSPDAPRGDGGQNPDENGLTAAQQRALLQCDGCSSGGSGPKPAPNLSILVVRPQLPATCSPTNALVGGCDIAVRKRSPISVCGARERIENLETHAFMNAAIQEYNFIPPYLPRPGPVPCSFGMNRCGLLQRTAMGLGRDERV